MKVFYRYVRPLRFNPKRMEFDTLPAGGVCLRFEENIDGSMLLSHSRCHPQDHFNKTVAKRIADHRATNAKTDCRLVAAMSARFSDTMETDILVKEVIKLCREQNCDGSFLIVRYLHIEWLGLADALERIAANNYTEKIAAGVWRTATGAMDMVTAYKGHNAPADRQPGN